MRSGRRSGEIDPSGDEAQETLQRGKSEVVGKEALAREADLGSRPISATLWLCDPGEVTVPL